MFSLKLSLKAGLMLAVYATFAAVSGLNAGEVKTFSRVVTAADDEFVIEVPKAIGRIEGIVPKKLLDPR